MIHVKLQADQQIGFGLHLPFQEHWRPRLDIQITVIAIYEIYAEGT